MIEKLTFRRKRVILLICSFAYFIANLDATIVNVTLPSIAHDYGINIISTRNILIIFSFMYGISIPIGSYLSDKFGVKTIFIAAAFIFGFSSLMCGLSRNLQMLEFMRGLQGVSAAFFTPVARTIVIKYSTKETIVNNMANVMSVGLLGQTLGPFVGGMITAHSSWHWVFFINVPLCILAVALAFYYLKNIKEEKTGRFDVFSFVSITLAISSFLYMCQYVAAWHIDKYRILWVLFILAASGAAYYIYSLKRPVNIINTTLFRDKIFKVAILSSLLTRNGISAMSFVLVIILSKVYGFSDERIGNILLFYGLGIWLSKFLIPILTRYVKIQKLILMSAVSIFCCLLLIIVLTHFKSVWFFVFSLIALGLSASLYYGYQNGLALQRIDKSDSSQASTIMSLSIYICQSSSVSIFSIFYILSNKITELQSGRIIIALALLSVFVLASIIYLAGNKDFMKCDNT